MLGSNDLIRKFTVKFGEVSDGMSNTICFIEEAGKQNRYFRGVQVPATAPGGGFNLNSFYGDWNVARHVRGWGANVISNPRLLEGCSVINVLNDDNPYSFHTGGVQMVRGDGSVSFLSDGVDVGVFIGLTSRDGGETFSNPE